MSNLAFNFNQSPRKVVSILVWQSAIHTICMPNALNGHVLYYAVFRKVFDVGADRPNVLLPYVYTRYDTRHIFDYTLSKKKTTTSNIHTNMPPSPSVIAPRVSFRLFECNIYISSTISLAMNSGQSNRLLSQHSLFILSVSDDQFSVCACVVCIFVSMCCLW